MRREPRNPGTWPRLMRAETAAAYCDERSVEAFTRRVGTVYPEPINVSGRGRLWLREDLDTAIEQLARKPSMVHDLAREFGAS
jgi:hypothetical protein